MIFRPTGPINAGFKRVTIVHKTPGRKYTHNLLLANTPVVCPACLINRQVGAIS